MKRMFGGQVRWEFGSLRLLEHLSARHFVAHNLCWAVAAKERKAWMTDNEKAMKGRRGRREGRGS